MIVGLVLAQIDKARLGLNNVSNIKDKITSPRTPNSTDDLTKGFGLRSLWIDPTARKAYICVKADKNAAVWLEIGKVGGGGGISIDDFNTLFAGKTTTSLNEGTRLYHTAERVASHPDVQQAKSIVTKLGVPSVHTLTTNGAGWQTVAYLPTIANTSYMVEVKIVAKRTDLMTQSGAYSISALYRNTDGVLYHTVKDKLELEEVIAWDATTSKSDANITIDVKGELNKIINWKAYVTIYSV